MANDSPRRRDVRMNSTKQAATRLGTAEDTARNVLKRVFEQLDISRQSELAVLLGQLVLW